MQVSLLNPEPRTLDPKPRTSCTLEPLNPKPEPRYHQEVVWRRLVLEEARQQSEDIAILKAEVDRLRQRTFPSFAKNYNAQLSR